MASRVASTLLGLHHISGRREVGDDVVGAPLGDVHREGDVPKAGPRVTGDAQESLAVVAEEGPPGAHHGSL